MKISIIYVCCILLYLLANSLASQRATCVPQNSMFSLLGPEFTIHYRRKRLKFARVTVQMCCPVQDHRVTSVRILLIRGGDIEANPGPGADGPSVCCAHTVILQNKSEIGSLLWFRLEEIPYGTSHAVNTQT